MNENFDLSRSLIQFFVRVIVENSHCAVALWVVCHNMNDLEEISRIFPSSLRSLLLTRCEKMIASLETRNFLVPVDLDVFFYSVKMLIDNI